MLFARLRHGDFEGYGLVEDGRVQPLEGDLFGEHLPSGEALPLDSVRLLAPVARPGKILAAAVHYPSRGPGSQAMTGLSEAPKKPELFLKPSSSIAGPEETIVLPRDAGRVDYEGELVAAICRLCRGVRPAA